MMRPMIWSLMLLAAACGGQAAMPVDHEAAPSLRDELVSYAMASCFAVQRNDYLRDQGQRWAGAIMQHAHGPAEKWVPVATAVKAELDRSGIAVGQGDGPQSPTISLPVMTCGRIAATPSVNRAITTATKALAEDYSRQAR